VNQINIEKSLVRMLEGQEL